MQQALQLSGAHQRPREHREYPGSRCCTGPTFSKHVGRGLVIRSVGMNEGVRVEGPMHAASSAAVWGGTSSQEGIGNAQAYNAVQDLHTARVSARPEWRVGWVVGLRARGTEMFFWGGGGADRSKSHSANQPAATAVAAVEDLTVLRSCWLV